MGEMILKKSAVKKLEYKIYLFEVVVSTKNYEEEFTRTIKSGATKGS